MLVFEYASINRGQVHHFSATPDIQYQEVSSEVKFSLLAVALLPRNLTAERVSAARFGSRAPQPAHRSAVSSGYEPVQGAAKEGTSEFSGCEKVGPL